MVNVIVILVLLLLAGLFFFLAFRSGRARRAWVKWPGLLLSGLLGLLLLAISGVAVYGFYKLTYPPYTYTVADLQVAGTSEQVARGEQLAYICLDCHSSTGDLPLDGSKDNLFAGGPPMGVLYGTNLTAGGPLKDWSDGEILRAIREGISKDGRPLVGMTSEPFHYFSDDDAQALIAYLRAQPAVDRDLPKRDLNVLMALLLGAGLAPTAAQPPITAPVVAPSPGTPEYGQYLVYTSGCRDCHGADLTGGTNPFIPTGPNLTVTMPGWSEAQFITLIRTGINNTGRAVDPKSMLWMTYNKAFSDAELRDIYTYLQGLPMVSTSK